MILVDTSIWIEHLARPVPALASLISDSLVVQHPFVTGEILAGNPTRRDLLVFALRKLPPIEPVDEDRFHEFLEDSRLWGTGLGFVDIHLVAAAASIPGTRIWTSDRRMFAEAAKLDLAYRP